MTNHAAATFAISAWDEQPYDEFAGGRKLTRAHVKKTYHGEIAGESTVEYLMSYAEDGSAQIVGLERVVGRLGERSGSFVLQHLGTFKDGIVTIALLVVPGSGTDDLQGLSGDGGFAVGHTSPFPITLNYAID